MLVPSAESGRRIWAAVPFKGPSGTKSRLAGLLDASERASISRAMLADVLDALLATPAFELVLLLTPSGTSEASMAGHPDALPVNPRLTFLDEPTKALDGGQQARLNAALAQAQIVATGSGATHLLILPADLPLVQAADLAALIDAAVTPGVVVAPDRGAGGTNALLMSPPDAIVPAFGEGSFARHLALAAESGVPSTVLSRPGLSLDLDTPADVASLLASGQTSRAVRLLRTLRIPERLERYALGQARSATI